MNIESITVTNFCSFGEKNNILQINPGVTTIVGMNESGKNNLDEFNRVHRFGKWDNNQSYSVQEPG